MRRRVPSLLALAICGWSSSGCGLVRAPFRVAGAVVGTTYESGAAVARKTSKLFEGQPADPKPAKSGDAEGKTAAAKEDPAGKPGGTADAGVLPPVPVDLPPLPDELPPLPENLPQRPEDLPPP